jgi:hypothetical protein
MNQEGDMTWTFRKRYLVPGFILIFMLCFSGLWGEEKMPQGNIEGFIYDKDGTTPLEGAIVRFSNVSTGAVYESLKSDMSGAFRIEGIERGVYLFGVITEQGEFNSIEPIGVTIQENETAKLSLSLIPYEGKIASSIMGFPEEKEIKGEVLVGRVVKFYPAALTADVFIFKEKLQYRDRIHVKAPEVEKVKAEEEVSDFYQEAYNLRVNGSRVKKVPPGYVVSIPLKERVDIGDLVYVVRRKRLLPLLLIPVGIGTSIIIPASPATPEKK